MADEFDPAPLQALIDDIEYRGAPPEHVEQLRELVRAEHAQRLLIAKVTAMAMPPDDDQGTVGLGYVLRTPSGDIPIRRFTLATTSTPPPPDSLPPSTP